MLCRARLLIDRDILMPEASIAKCGLLRSCRNADTWTASEHAVDQPKHRHCPFSATQTLTTKYALFAGTSAAQLMASQMFARSVARLPATAARRGFHTTPRQMGSPFHYPEGPRSNIPFNPMTKWFALRYWSFMGT